MRNPKFRIKNTYNATNVTVHRHEHCEAAVFSIKKLPALFLLQFYDLFFRHLSMTYMGTRK